MKITLNWVNRNTSEEGTRVYRSEEPIETTEGLTPYATLEPGASSFVDEEAIQNKLYYYRLEVFKGNDSYLGNQTAISAIPYTGPGPQRILRGDFERGYFGELTSQELLTGDELALKLNFTAGSPINSTIPWIKFAHKGKILFIPKKDIRYNLTWAQLYQAGLVYGTDDDGPAFHSSLTPTNQLRIIETGGDEFKVRLIKGGNTMIGQTWNQVNNFRESTGLAGSEWNDIFYSVMASMPPDQDWQNLHNYPDTDIGYSNSYTTLCQEVGSEAADMVLVRGTYNFNQAAQWAPFNNSRPSININGNQSYYMCWKPVLEFLPT